MERIYAICLAVLLATSGCVTLSEAGEDIRVVETQEEVADCEFLTEVEAPPPFVGPNDAENELRNKTALADGDVLHVTSMGVGTARGEAYDCSDSN